jgi:hypothetical protein
VDRLIALASDLAVQKVPLSEVQEIDEAYWFDGDSRASCRDIAEHALLIEQADLSFPIIMSSDHRVMDGMHRVLKALNAGLPTIDALIFAVDPEPDYVDVFPEELPY